MKITSTDFVKSAFEESHWTKTKLPEIAFLGRSNVGKSSLINSLLGVKGLARTSGTPGRTQAINFFLINKKIQFVDFPGFGYARVPQAMRKAWGEMVTNFLANRKQLVLSIHIVDSRHEPTNQDLQLNEWLRFNGKPYLVVATKTDKLSGNELQKSLLRAKQQLDVEQVIPYSSTKLVGREKVWRVIEDAIKNRASNDLEVA